MTKLQMGEKGLNCLTPENDHLKDFQILFLVNSTHFAKTSANNYQNPIGNLYIDDSDVSERCVLDFCHTIGLWLAK